MLYAMPTPAATPPRALLYGRVSSATTDGRSVDSQLAEGRKVVAREGWQLVGEHRDDGISASRYSRGKDRPGWQAAMDAITGGLVDLLVVWEISRATRERAVWAALLAACTDAKVKLVVGGRVHDPSDPDDSFLLDLTAALAVRESSTTSKRVRRHLDDRARRGQPHGKIAYGYTRVYEEHSGRTAGQVVDPETGPIVREIVVRILAGEACYSVAADLERRGVPSPHTVARLRNRRPTVETPWRPDQVRRIALSPTNAGLRVLRGEVLPGVAASWEPLVSRTDHARVTEILRDPARRTNIGRTTSRHLLVSLARCAECGAGVRRIKNRNVPSYVCSRGYCVARAMRFVDEYVTTALLAYLQRPDLAEVFARDDTVEQQERAAAARERDELRATLEGWYEAAVAGTVSPSGLARVETGLLQRIEAADDRARPRPASPVLANLLQLTRGEDTVEARWELLTVPSKREVIRELMDIRIKRTRRGARHLDPDSIEIRWRV